MSICNGLFMYGDDDYLIILVVFIFFNFVEFNYVILFEIEKLIKLFLIKFCVFDFLFILILKECL